MTRTVPCPEHTSFLLICQTGRLDGKLTTSDIPDKMIPAWIVLYKSAPATELRCVYNIPPANRIDSAFEMCYTSIETWLIL